MSYNPAHSNPFFHPAITTTRLGVSRIHYDSNTLESFLSIFNHDTGHYDDRRPDRSSPYDPARDYRRIDLIARLTGADAQQAIS